MKSEHQDFSLSLHRLVENPAGLITLDVTPWMQPNQGYIARILVPEAHRNKGYGTEIMQELCELADSLGKQLVVHPTTNYGSNLKRLQNFFVRFGFEERHGTYYRDPK